jgi:hypothetical protein
MALEALNTVLRGVVVEADAEQEPSEISEPAGYPGGCPICRGVGFVFDDEAWERSGFRGGLVLCPLCGESRLQSRFERLSGLTPMMRGWTLDSIAKGDGRDEAVRVAREALKNPRGFLTFWGSWGTGKTYLLAAIVNEAVKKGMSALYTTVARMLDDLRETFSEDRQESYSQVWHKFASVRILALDELEKFNTTEWAEEKFFEVIEHRYNNADRMLTVFATNSEVGHGKRVIDRTRFPGYLESRLMDGRFKVIHIGGGDIRPKLQWSS